MKRRRRHAPMRCHRLTATPDPVDALVQRTSDGRESFAKIPADNPPHDNQRMRYRGTPSNGDGQHFKHQRHRQFMSGSSPGNTRAGSNTTTRRPRTCSMRRQSLTIPAWPLPSSATVRPPFPIRHDDSPVAIPESTAGRSHSIPRQIPSTTAPWRHRTGRPKGGRPCLRPAIP